MTDNIFQDIVPSLDTHTEELHRAILGAQRLIRAYDRAAHTLIEAYKERGYGVLEEINGIQRVYERRQG